MNIRKQVNSPLANRSIRVPDTDGLVNVQHIDVVVPRELVQRRAVRVRVHDAGEVVRLFEGGGSGSAGEVDRRRGILRVVPGFYILSDNVAR